MRPRLIAACLLHAAVPHAQAAPPPWSPASIEAAATTLRASVASQLKDATQPIDTITLYGIHVDKVRKFSWGSWPGRQHIFIAITAGGHTGWSEYGTGANPDHTTVPLLQQKASRLQWLATLKGQTVSQAFHKVLHQREKQHHASLENAEIALLDLAGKLTHQSTTKLLGLTGTAPVPGVYCILNDDPTAIAQEAATARAQQLTTHVKIKLYGKPELDEKLIHAARAQLPPTTWLTGDPNEGYSPTGANKKHLQLTPEQLPTLSATLTRFAQSGLNGCEDPASLSVDQWQTLTKTIPTLDLIPDTPLRPVWHGITHFQPDMARLCNLHPHEMGDMFTTIAFGQALLQRGHRLMIGDASLIGPGCDAWTHLAIGLRAQMVEAIEKPQESTAFQKSATQRSIKRTTEGTFSADPTHPGFGAIIDPILLKTHSYQSIPL